MLGLGMNPKHLQSLNSGSRSAPAVQASPEVGPRLTKFFLDLWLSALDLRRGQWAVLGGGRSARERSSPSGEEGLGFPAQCWTSRDSHGHSHGSLCLHDPSQDTETFFPPPCTWGGGEYTKFEINFICKNANSRAKNGTGQYVVMPTHVSLSPSIFCFFPHPHVPIPAPF